MKKKNIYFWPTIFTLYLILLFYFAIIKSNFWGNILSPLGAFIGFVFTYRAYKNTNYMKGNWFLLSLACLIWTFLDIAWAITDMVYKIDPNEVSVFYYGYMLINVILAYAVIKFFLIHKNKWNKAQLILDIFATVCVIMGLVWRILFKNEFYNVIELKTEDLTSFITLIIDIIIMIVIFIVYTSMRSVKVRLKMRFLITSFVIFCFADFLYIYQSIHELYISNRIVDALYILSLIMFAFCGFFESISPTDESTKKKKKEPENLGSNKKVLFLLIAPAINILLYGIIWEEILYYVVVLLFHQMFSVFVQKSIYNTILLNEKSAMNEELEKIVLERTEELNSANHILQELSQKDSITGLYNRKFFIEKLEEMIGNAEDTETIYMLCMDLDRFKIINDTYGHDIGDILLEKMAKRFYSIESSHMLLARLGGDEFAIACKSDCTKEIIEDKINKLIELCEQPIIIEPYQLHLSVSIGIASFPLDALDRSTLMKHADIAMYDAKSHNKNAKYSFFNSRLSDIVKRRHELETLLKTIDYDEELIVLYQPQFRTQDKKLVGMEALIRWKSKVYGMISPVEFIPIAEETGLIVNIGEWVIRKALRQIKIFNEKYKQNLRVGINISPKQLDGIGFISMLQKAISEIGVPTSWVDLELTESCAMREETSVEELFAVLAGMGVSISIDDFGTGYSSLSYLKRFDIDCLKIAKPLIDNISEDFADEEIVRAIISLAKTMNLRVIAEGVETKEQVDKLIELSCDEIQGYIYGKPVSPDVFEEMFIINN